MPRKPNPKPKSGDVRLTLVVPVKLLNQVESRAKEISIPGAHCSRSDAVRIALHHFVDHFNQETK